MLTTEDLLAGRFRLLGLLGQGATADVYDARDESTGEAVALKLVRSGDPEIARRFAQEARALARLKHPSIVRLLGTGHVDGHAYLVMERVDGVSLARQLRRGPLSSARVADLGAQVADALAYAHALGIVHRDVKPSNILLGSDGRARLGDFGVARLLDDATLTLAGTTVGTAAYMAPEQLDDNVVGAGADVWSLGAVLVEALTGRRAFEGPSPVVVARRLAGSIPAPRDLPACWRLLLDGMMDPRPTQRLDASAVGSIIRAPTFREEWTPGAGDEPPETLLALGRAGAGRGDLASDETIVGGATAPPGPPRRARRATPYTNAAIAAGLVVALGVGFALRAATGATSPTTTTVATTTTLVAHHSLTVPEALGVFTRDVAYGALNAQVDPPTAQSLDAQASQAVIDVSAHQSDQAANDLAQAAQQIVSSVASGSLAPVTGSKLQADLATLATALGLSGATTTTTPPATTTTTPVAPGPGQGPGHGHGNGNGNGGGNLFGGSFP